MSIASEITRINNNIANAYTQCSNKGATMPATQNSANLANTISTISGGGGADLDNYFNRIIDFKSNNNRNGNFLYKMLKKVPSITTSGINSLEYAFYDLDFENITFENIDCSNINSLQGLFSSSTYLKTITLNFTNTSNIQNIRSLFSDCSNLETINGLSTLSLSGQMEMRQAFSNCGNIKHLDLSSWHITGTISGGRATNTFAATYKLATLDISNIDLSNLTTFNGMFTSCGTNCLQSDGAYADGIPYVYVKNATEQNWVLTASNGHPSTWSTNNVVIKS